MIAERLAPETTEQLPFAYLLKNYADYNLWANYKLINWLRKKPEDLLEQAVPSSFPSIKETLIHIWQTERYWYTIIRNAEPETVQDFTGGIQDLFTLTIDQSSDIADYINTLAEESLTEPRLIVSPWFQSNFPLFDYIMHCINHSTYHRGQVITIGRILGFTDAPMTDYNYYNINGR